MKATKCVERRSREQPFRVDVFRLTSKLRRLESTGDAITEEMVCASNRFKLMRVARSMSKLLRPGRMVTYRGEFALVHHEGRLKDKPGDIDHRQ